MNRQRISACLSLALAVCMLGMTQPQHHPDAPPPDEQPPGETSDSAPEGQPPRGRLGLEVTLDPEALRIRLERMVERGQDMAQRGQAAIDKLDSGAPAQEVLNELRPASDSSDERSERREDMRNTSRREAMGSPNRQAAIEEDRAAIHGFIQSEFPDLWNNIKPILEHDPHSAERLLGKMAPQIREILALKRSYPELAAIKTTQMRAEFDFVEAARVYRTVLNDPDAGNDQIERALGIMRFHAEARFNAELRAKQLEIARLESHLNQLRVSIDALEDQREHEVARIVTAAQKNAERLSRQQKQRKQPKGQRQDSGDD